MKSHIRRRIPLLALLLAACMGQSSDAPQSVAALSARYGARWSYEIMMSGKVRPMLPFRPSAILGPYIATFLSVPAASLSHASVSGILSGTALLFGETTLNESYALLEELGLILRVNVPDRLNRSLNRDEALTSYQETLVDIAQRSRNHLAQLEMRETERSEQVRGIRSGVSQIRRDLSAALRENDYASASAHQADLSSIEAELAIADAQHDEIRDIIDLFEDSIEIAAKRTKALEINREALIAGVTVTDIPGAEDIGVLEEAERGNRRADPDEVFGPTGL